MSQTTIVAITPLIALILVAAVVALDIFTNPEYVAERRAQRDKQVWINRWEPKQRFPHRTARNTSRHRRMY